MHLYTGNSFCYLHNCRLTGGIVPPISAYGYTALCIYLTCLTPKNEDGNVLAPCLFYDRFANTFWNCLFSHARNIFRISLCMYGANGANITCSEFTERTWLPWIEIRVPHKSPPQYFEKILYKWNHSRTHINRFLTLLTEPGAQWPTISSDRVNVNHVNQLHNWHRYRKIPLWGPTYIFIPQCMATAHVRRFPNLDEPSNILQMFGKGRNCPNPNFRRFTPTLIFM